MATPNGSADIFDFTPGGGQPASLAPSDAADVEPAWSPDGQMVVFVSTRSGGNTDLYLLRLGTGGITRLTTGAGTEGQPAWAPDSRRIVFTEISNDTRQLRWLDIERPGQTFPVQTGEGRAENPALEP